MPTPEALARQTIDQKLTAAGWIVQDFRALNLGAGPGVAVREFQTASGSSTAGKSGPSTTLRTGPSTTFRTGPSLRADYVLFVDRKAVDVVEAKPEGTTLPGVFEQSARFFTGSRANVCV